MVGGSWWGCQHLAHLEVEIYDFIDVETNDDFGDRWDKICEWFEYYGKDSVIIEAYINEGEDNSTNYHEFDIDEVFYPTEFDEYINSCYLLSDDEKRAAIKKFGDFVDGLDAHEFELYEPDYPEYEEDY
jgi:hypothetical protein